MNERLSKPVDAEIDGEFVYHLGDALSTVRDVVDDEGDVIRSFEFDEYGNLLNSSGSGAASPKTWIGGLSVNDDRADSGLWNMGHRNYDGVLGRFISRDPIGFNGGLNLYSYPANPVNSVDPSGLDFEYFENTRIKVSGNPKQVAKTLELLRKLNSKPFGKKLVSDVNARCEREDFYLDIEVRDEGSFLDTATRDSGRFKLAHINLNLDPDIEGLAFTSDGVSRGFPPMIKLGHELGHVLGRLDDGPGRLNNVMLTENPLRLEHGLPMRLEYSPDTYRDGKYLERSLIQNTGIGTALDAVSDFFGNFCGGNK